MGKLTSKQANKNEKGGKLLDYRVIIRPVITEKSALMGSSSNGAVFMVDPRATKTEIRNAVERIFGVQVVAVRTVNHSGKPKRTTGHIGRRDAYKKAYITLKEGQRIDIVEGV